MTIARRLILLLAVPLLILLALGIISLQRLARIEERSRFLADDEIESLAALGNVSQTFTELRVNLRSILLTEDAEARPRARALFEADRAELTRLLRLYADRLVSNDQERRLLDEYRSMSGEWIASAERILSLADGGRRDEALAALNGPLVELGMRLSKASGEWIRYDEDLARTAGRTVVETTQRTQRTVLIAFGLALALSSALGALTFRRIVRPIRGLQSSVEAIAGGDYAEGGAVHEGAGRDRRARPLRRRAQARRDGHGRAALDQDARRADHGGAAGRGDARRVRVPPRLDARSGPRRRRRGVLSLRERARARGCAGSRATASRRERPSGCGSGEGLAGQCARERKPGEPGGHACRTICASSRASAQPPRPRPRPGP